MILFQLRRVIALLRKPARPGPKVFVIGMNKTGTSSLAEALRLLGYDHFSAFYNRWPELHYTIWKRFKWKRFFVWLASKYESFDDSPWYDPSLIRVLDKNFQAQNLFCYTLVKKNTCVHIKGTLP